MATEQTAIGQWVSRDNMEWDILQLDSLGVSNVALSAVISLIVFVATVLFFYWKGKAERQRIVHPQLEADIEHFREAIAGTVDETSLQRLRAARERTERDCPICYGESSYEVLTNCGHVFCCECIIGYWRHSASPVTPVACAICRTPVTMLLPVEWVSNGADDGDGLHENDIRLNDYNRRFSGERPWLDYLYDLPVLLPYAFQNLADFNGLGLLFRIRIVVCCITAAIYLLTPFDVFPESVYGVLGLLDDVFVLLLLCLYFVVMIRQFMARRGEARLGVFD